MSHGKGAPANRQQLHFLPLRKVTDGVEFSLATSWKCHANVPAVGSIKVFFSLAFREKHIQFWIPSLGGIMRLGQYLFVKNLFSAKTSSFLHFGCWPFVNIIHSTASSSLIGEKCLGFLLVEGTEIVEAPANSFFFISAEIT